jgi:hypothetical protein
MSWLGKIKRNLEKWIGSQEDQPEETKTILKSKRREERKVAKPLFVVKHIQPKGKCYDCSKCKKTIKKVEIARDCL